MSSNITTLLDFLDRFDADRAAGRHLPLSHYLQAFPGDEETVAHEYLRRCAEAVEATPPPVVAGGGAGAVGSFRLLRELGRGGQGSVYLADDLRMRRRVALKLLAPSAVGSDSARLRFRREAEAIARLDHPSLCGIHEADLDGETPFLAMRYVAGETLRDRLQRARAATPATPPGGREITEVLRMFERLGRALHAAHEAGIVHRDVKPGNILIGTDGVPVLVDFGVARLERRNGEPDTMTLTAPGQAFGTPGYMAPEQRRSAGETDGAVDRRADVYALGVVLHECLTLQSPVAAGSSAAEAAVFDPQRHNDAVAGELRTVVLMATAAEPGHRYPTALAFAEDLRRICEFEPILARPAGAWLRARRWLRRHRRAVVVTAASTLALVLVAALWIARQVSDLLHAARQETLQARTTARTQPQLALGAALSAWQRSPDDFANTLAIEALGQDHMVWENEIVANPRSSAMCPTVAIKGELVCTATSRSLLEVREVLTGKVLARYDAGVELSSVTAGPGPSFFAVFADCSVQRWDRATGFTAWSCPAPALSRRRILEVRTVPGEGERLAILLRDGGVVLWDAASGRQEWAELPQVTPGDPGLEPHRIVLFSDDGNTLVTAFGRPRDSGGSLFPGNERILVRELAAPEQAWALPGHAARVNDLQLSPDRRALAVAYEDGVVDVFDPAARRLFFTRSWRGEAFCARFHPNGRQLVVCLGGSRQRLDPELVNAPIRVLDCDTGQELFAVSGHAQRGVMAIAFSPDGHLFASAGNDRRVVVRSASALEREPLRTFGQTHKSSMILHWHEDSRHLVSFDGSTTSCWDVEQPAIPILTHDGAVTAVRVAPDGSRVVTGTATGAVTVWQRESGVVERRLPIAGRTVADLRYADQGRLLAVRTAGPGLHVFEAASWTGSEVAFASDVTCWAVDASAPRAAVGLDDGTLMLVDLAAGRARAASRPGDAAGSAPRRIDCVAFARDGRTLLTGGAGRAVDVWDVERGEHQLRLEVPAVHEPRVYPDLDRFLAVHALSDGRWLLSLQEPSVWLCDLSVAKPMQRVVSGAPTAVQITFLDSNARGDLVALGADVSQTTLFRWPEQSIVEPVTRSNGKLSALQFGRTGRFLLTASYDGTARLLRTDGAPRFWSLLVGHDGPILAADLSADERWVATASGDGTVRIWPTEPVEFCAATGRRGRFNSRFDVESRR